MLQKFSLWWILALLITTLFHLFVIDQLDPYFVTILIHAGINIILASSLNLINGFAGQFSMGHAGFMAVGAYSSSVISIYLRDTQIMSIDDLTTQFVLFPLILLCGGFAAALIGLLVGLPSLRLKGDYLAIVTLGFGEIIRVCILNIDSIGAARGLTNIPALTSFLSVYSLALITLFVISRIVTSPSGRRFLAVREDEIAAEAIGVNTTNSKVAAFTIGAFFAGMAGGLFAHFLRFLSPSIFDISKSFECIIMVVLGGMGSLSGSVCAAFFLTILREALRPLQQFTGTDYRMVIYSLLLIILMLTRPRGLFGSKEVGDLFPERFKNLFGLRKEAPLNEEMK